MQPSLTDRLCTRCGLCCDGSLFADVELAGRREATRLELLGLDVEDDDGAVLLQPCRALRGRRCGIYSQRPECCRTFECSLLLDARSGAVSVDRALKLIATTLAQIRRVKSLLARLDHLDPRLPMRECCEDALAGEEGEHPSSRRRRAELQLAMDDVKLRIRRHFLRREHGRAGEP